MRTKKTFLPNFYPKKTIKKIEKKILLLGPFCTYQPIQFLNFRLLLTLILFFFLLFYTKAGYIIAPIVSFLFYYLYEKVFLDYAIQKRIKKLEQEAIFFFEVLELTLESSRNLKQALELTTRNIDNELSLEFKKTLQECQLGKSFTESLEKLKERIPSDTLKNIILNLTQSSIFGMSIKESLNSQLDYLREKQMLEIKAEISKLPTKISIISVLFFIPLLLLIILSPVIINFLVK